MIHLGKMLAQLRHPTLRQLIIYGINPSCLSSTQLHCFILATKIHVFLSPSAVLTAESTEQ